MDYEDLNYILRVCGRLELINGFEYLIINKEFKKWGIRWDNIVSNEWVCPIEKLFWYTGRLNWLGIPESGIDSCRIFDSRWELLLTMLPIESKKRYIIRGLILTAIDVENDQLSVEEMRELLGKWHVYVDFRKIIG